MTCMLVMFVYYSFYAYGHEFLSSYHMHGLQIKYSFKNVFTWVSYLVIYCANPYFSYFTIIVSLASELLSLYLKGLDWDSSKAQWCVLIDLGQLLLIFHFFHVIYIK